MPHAFVSDETTAKKRIVSQMLIRKAFKAPWMPNVLKQHFNDLRINELETHGFNFP